MSRMADYAAWLEENELADSESARQRYTVEAVVTGWMTGQVH